MQEKSFSNRIKIFTFALTILVIWVHSVNLPESWLLEGGLPGIARGLEDFFTNTLGQTAVPGFFMVSAFLFFRNAPEAFSAAFIWQKWKSRALSVLLPYLLWNGLYYAGRLLLSCLLSRAPGEAGYIPFDLETLYQAVVHYLYNPVFWYLWELILLILLTPLIWVLLKNRWAGLLALLLAFLAAANWNLLPVHVVNEDALFYFMLGGYGAFHGKWLLIEGKGAGWGLLIAAALVVLYGVAVGPSLEMMQKLFGEPAFTTGASVFFRAAFPVCLFFLLTVSIDRVPALKAFAGREYLPRFMENNFLIYATHYILVRGINGALQRALPASLPEALQAGVLLVAYFMLPVLCVFMGLWGSRILERISPALHRTLTGGR